MKNILFLEERVTDIAIKKTTYCVAIPVLNKTTDDVAAECGLKKPVIIDEKDEDCKRSTPHSNFGTLFISSTHRPKTETELRAIYTKVLEWSNYSLRTRMGCGCPNKIAIEPMGALLGISPETDAKIAIECVMNMPLHTPRCFTTIAFASTDPKVLYAFKQALSLNTIHYQEELNKAIKAVVENTLPKAINMDELINALSKEMLNKMSNEYKYMENYFPIKSLTTQLESGLKQGYDIFVTGKWTLSDVKALVSEIFTFLISCGTRGNVKDTWNKTHYSLNTKNIKLPQPPR